MRQHVALVGPEEEENLALRYLAAGLEAGGFGVDIVPFNCEQDLSRALQAIMGADPAPILVGVSLAFQWRAKDCLALVMALKEAGYTGHITAGGHFGTFVAGELLTDFPELDSICRYEAETTIVELARAVAAGQPLEQASGLVIRSDAGPVTTALRPSQDLAALPWPDRRGRPASCLGHRIAPIVGSRGCYANCAFCCIAAWHRLAAAGPRFRTRPVEDVADEMAWLRRHRDIDIFIFHDDNFFLPTHDQSMDRICSLADALDTRQIGPIATVVKARPTDVTPEVFGAMRDRLGCIRTFLGIETATPQGLTTLRRNVSEEQNHLAMRVLDDLGIYVCFNMLIFDPDATVESLEANLRFMERYSDWPHNFGRVELYAGTPLLERMQAEGRCRGDYFGWDYNLANPQMDRIFRLAIQCFTPRNFAAGALANRLQATRFDVTVSRHFHPEAYQESWLTRVRQISAALVGDSVRGLREIIAFTEHPKCDDRRFAHDLARRMRGTERQIGESASQLEQEIQAAVGAACHHGRPIETATTTGM